MGAATTTTTTTAGAASSRRPSTRVTVSMEQTAPSRRRFVRLEEEFLQSLQAMLIHGMIVQGTSQRDHYGPVAIGAPDERAVGECRKLGRNLAALAVKLHG